jgi:hypothetical protein
MEIYSGTGRLTDDVGRAHAVDVEIEEIGDGQWAGVLTGPLDWDVLMGERDLDLELAVERSLGLPRHSRVRIDLAIGDRACAYGTAALTGQPELQASASPGRVRRRRRSERAIHWHAAR